MRRSSAGSRDDQSNRMVSHIFSFVEPWQLNLSNERWRLDSAERGDVSDLRGYDVINDNQNDKGRYSLGLGVNTGDRPVTRAWSIDRLGLRAVRVKDFIENAQINIAASGFTYDDSALTLTSVGAFSGYTFEPNDTFETTSGTIKSALIVNNPDNDTIVLQRSLGSDLDGQSINGWMVRGYGYVYRAEGSIITETSSKIRMARQTYESLGKFDDKLVGELFFLNGDHAGPSGQAVRIKSINSVVRANDQIELDSDISGVWSDSPKKFNSRFVKTYDKRGIWVTNGNKIWLVQGGAYNKFVDIDEVLASGQSWNAALIHPGIMMVVSPSLIPRVIRIEDDPILNGESNVKMAGLLAPSKPGFDENRFVDASSVDRPSIKMKLSTTGGSIQGDSDNPPRYRVLVRGVNLIDNAESSFIHAYSTIDDENSIDVNNDLSTNSIIVWVGDSDDTSGDGKPVFDDRWSHIELWRSDFTGVNYHLEKRVEVASIKNEVDSTGGGFVLLSQDTTVNHLTLSDTELLQQVALLPSDLVTGGLPPICQDVSSLDGSVTICAGKANEDVETSKAGSQMHWHDDLVYSEPGGNFRLTKTGLYQGLNSIGTNEDDRVVIVHGGATGLTLGEYSISAVNNDYVELGENPNGLGATPLGLSDVEAYIKKSYDIDWPKIEDDEMVHTSRADRFRPESFTGETIRLSSSGDVFKKMVEVGRYVAVIMESGVHLLFFESGSVLTETVASSGEGTPWPESVVVVGNRVIWATAYGPNVMTVVSEPGDDGFRGRIEGLNNRRMKDWFSEADNNSWRIDAQYDIRNSVVRFRRKKNDNIYQSLQFSIENGMWTLLDDDSGVNYAISKNASNSVLNSPHMYSVTKEGSIFEVNHENIDHPYDDNIPQSIITVNDIITDQSIRRVVQSNAFTQNMLGDVVRFRSSNPNVDGLSRTITSATPYSITWSDPISELSVGDEWIIGANRFFVRFTLNGLERNSNKTMYGGTIRFLTGERNEKNASWPDPPDGKVSVKIYKDFDDSEFDFQDRVLQIYNDNDPGKDSIDRTFNSQAQGGALELEVSCIETRTDFRVQNIEVDMREEADPVIDVEK